MRYLVYVPGTEPFFTNWFEHENHFVDGMVVFDTTCDKYTIDGQNWFEIEHDKL